MSGFAIGFLWVTIQALVFYGMINQNPSGLSLLAGVSAALSLWIIFGWLNT